MPAAVAVSGKLCQDAVRLRFSAVIQPDRVSHPHACPPGDRPHQQGGHLINGKGVAGPDRRHLHQLPFQQLDTVILL